MGPWRPTDQNIEEVGKWMIEIKKKKWESQKEYMRKHIAASDWKALFHMLYNMRKYYTSADFEINGFGTVSVYSDDMLRKAKWAERYLRRLMGERL